MFIMCYVKFLTVNYILWAVFRCYVKMTQREVTYSRWVVGSTDDNGSVNKTPNKFDTKPLKELINVGSNVLQQL